MRGDDGVVTAVYANVDGAKSALVLANLNDRTAVARCTLEAPLRAVSARVIGHNEATVDLTKPIELSLAPHEVIVVAIDSALGR